MGNRLLLGLCLQRLGIGRLGLCGDQRLQAHDDGLYLVLLEVFGTGQNAYTMGLPPRVPMGGESLILAVSIVSGSRVGI